MNRKRIYDSGPLSLIQSVLAVLGATICFAVCLGLLWLMILIVAAGGLQLGLILGGVFIGFMAFLFLIFAVQNLYPVCLRYSIRVYLNGSNIEVVKPFPFNMLRTVLDRNRINSIEVIRKRRGGSVICVIYLFDASGPNLSDSETIGPFYDHEQAQAVAKAIQSELLLDNRNEVQLAQYSHLQKKVVSKIIFGFLIVYVMFIAFMIFSNWNRLTVINFGVAVLMGSFPLLLLYRILTEEKRTAM